MLVIVSVRYYRMRVMIVMLMWMTCAMQCAVNLLYVLLIIHAEHVVHSAWILF